MIVENIGGKIKMTKFILKYREIIILTLIGAAFGYFILSPFIMVISDMLHTKMLSEYKIYALYSNPWQSVLEVFRPYLFIWALIFTIFSGITGCLIGMYLEVKRKHLDKLNESYKKLEALEQLKDSLTHMIVHDLNNPLTVISGELQLLMMAKTEFNVEQKESLNLAFASTEDLKRMISNLLDINKMEENKLKLNYEKFNLEDLAQDVINQMNAITGIENKTVFLEATRNTPEMSADKELIRRTIANLVNNAVKHSPSGGNILIKTFFKEKDNNFYIQVKDSGEGIPEEYLNRIFDKFVQVENRKAKMGHGLGLTFCKMAVEAHGGKIWAESELDKGSTFYFTIPANK